MEDDDWFISPTYDDNKGYKHVCKQILFDKGIISGDKLKVVDYNEKTYTFFWEKNHFSYFGGYDV